MTLRHSLLPDGVVLVLGAHERVVSFGEAKRFAWALLADLDPDEAVACGAPFSPNEQGPLSAAGVDRQSLYGERRRAYLGALVGGPAGSREIGDVVQEDSGVVAARMAHLANLGLVYRASGGGKGSRNTYALTDKGRRYLGGRA